MKGTLINTATVVCGSLIGIALGKFIPSGMNTVVIGGMALGTVCIGIKTFLSVTNMLIPIAAMAVGGLVGTFLNINGGMESLQSLAGTSAAGKNNNGLLTAFVLFCVGPMTLLGCIQEGLEQKRDLLMIKSTLDGFAALFLASAYGISVLFSALPLLIVQGLITLAATPLGSIAKDKNALEQLNGVGGVILVGIGFKMLGIKGLEYLKLADFIPALIIGPALGLASSKFANSKPDQMAPV